MNRNFRHLVAAALLRLANRVLSAVKLKHGPRSSDGWTQGTATCNGKDYKFQIKHFDEPSDFGIDGGRISKLWLRPENDRRPVLNYERGWDGGLAPRNASADVKEIYKALLKKFN